MLDKTFLKSKIEKSKVKSGRGTEANQRKSRKRQLKKQRKRIKLNTKPNLTASLESSSNTRFFNEPPSSCLICIRE